MKGLINAAVLVSCIGVWSLLFRVVVQLHERRVANAQSVATSVATPTIPIAHAGEASWSIQGMYSHRNCDNQPGTRPFYLEADDGTLFFLECMR
jgi:hypothetical protein